LLFPRHHGIRRRYAKLDGRPEPDIRIGGEHERRCIGEHRLDLDRFFILCRPREHRHRVVGRNRNGRNDLERRNIERRDPLPRE
jgi:hypothetical protein